MKLLANAKLNLTLDIKGKREDGYHLIDSVFQSVSLYDEINIEKADTLSVAFSDKTIPEKESVAYKCAAAFFELCGIKSGAKIDIKNNIPTCSGMGGGSSDAAAIITGLNCLFGAGLSVEELIKLATPYGADIPFCLVGGTARVSGVGEKIEALDFAGEHPVMIIKDGLKASTAEIYRALDKVPLKAAKTEFLIKAVEKGDKKGFFGGISNAFLEVSDIKNEKTVLENSGALAVGLSGSGPSVFGIYENKKARDMAFDNLSADHNCYKAEFSKKGITIE